MAITINGSGTISGLSVGGLPDGSVDADTLASDSVTAAKLKSDAIAAGDLPAGSIIQVVDVYSTTRTSQSITLNTQTTLNAFSASITPSSTSSKILIFARWTGEFSHTNSHDGIWGLTRGSTFIGNAPEDGNRLNAIQMHGAFYTSDANSTPESVFFQYVDSPSTTSSVTYKLNCQWTNSGTVYTNRTVVDSNHNSQERGTSGITLMEIAG